MNIPYVISVDWLQVYTLSSAGHPIPRLGTLQESDYLFEFKEQDYQTAMFKTVVNVLYRGKECAVVECEPRSSKLKPSMTIIKLSNRVLYSTKYIDMLYSLMRALKVTYKGITRIDLCYDCIKFADGRSPSRFINNFVLVSDETIGGIARKGSDEFICHGKKAKGSSSKINYISFGSPQSRIRAYIYDKSVELAEVKDKPWIRETWEKNGLKPTEKEHVFRSEISIKSEGTDVLNMSTGELFRLSPKFLENQQTIEKLFHFYANKYLYFTINQGQKLRKNRPHLELYCNKPEITCKPVHISMSADTGRMEKICYNKLECLSTTYSDLSEPRRAALQSAMEFLKELEGIKSATLANERYLKYLDELKGRMFYDEHIIKYLAGIERVQDAQEALEREYSYYQYANQDFNQLTITN